MGLPVGKLVVGTNENDILARFFRGGAYEKMPIAGSISPSMDICVSSNFERWGLPPAPAPAGAVLLCPVPLPPWRRPRFALPPSTPVVF